MKKLIILVLILIVGFAVYSVMKDDSMTSATDTTPEGGEFKPNPENATFTIDGETITLTGGQNETTDGNFTEETTLLEERAHGDLNADGEEDTAVLLVRSGGGSGVFVYTASYVSGPVGYKGGDAVFIGDRISPQSISISNGVVSVTYLDRASDEPFAAEPTISTTKQFVLRNGEFQER